MKKLDRILSELLVGDDKRVEIGNSKIGIK